MRSPLGRLNPLVGPHYQDRIAELIRHEKPKVVIETGLETGLGAEYIISALDDNGLGHLWSIDPSPNILYTENPISHPRFTFVQAKSQDALTPLFEQVGPGYGHRQRPMD